MVISLIINLFLRSMVERVALCWPPTAWCSSPSSASLSLSTLRTSSTPCGEDNKWTLSKHPGHNLGRVPDWNRGQRAWNSDQKVISSSAGLWGTENGPKEPTSQCSEGCIYQKVDFWISDLSNLSATTCTPYSFFVITPLTTLYSTTWKLMIKRM